MTLRNPYNKEKNVILDTVSKNVLRKYSPDAIEVNFLSLLLERHQCQKNLPPPIPGVKKLAPWA